MNRAAAASCLPAVLLAVSLALPARAEPWACQMTVQCDGQDCFAIDDLYQILPADHAGELFLSSPSGDRPATRLSAPDALPAAYASAGIHAMGELMTITPDLLATVTFHRTDGPTRTTTFFGTCEAF
ncbi:hypothetical protein [Gymnodinialimonas ceratoperidinii]|uniref:Uncharacterized protein n=1 Tax=Gymnodinialimonas ceratoperidinii TaxID=2856823 RepID=A0A8F6YBJ9_9RHOB|nr:hypothetical protein [Gymnodinialimonas ceratoperidinii]QXT38275.1 hypothetical protein KYE46_09950 [Gymnodinialimonas ceratoperidinii]